jgi:predicted kinase
MINEEAEQLFQEVMGSLEFSSVPLKPIVLMIGGFQGSGKTTAINNLKDDLGLVVVSMDEIRQRLFDKKYLFSNKFIEIVKVATMKILENILQMGYSVVWDTNVTSSRIKQVEKILESENLNNYRLVKIYFETSKKELIERLVKREDVKSSYKGTVEELQESMKKEGKIDKNIYDMVINTEKLDAKAVAEVIRKKVKLL